MISIGHWGCFEYVYQTGFRRFGKSETEWYWSVFIDFE